MRAMDEDLQRVPVALLGFVQELACKIAQQGAHAQSPHLLGLIYCMWSVSPLVHAVWCEHLTPCEPFVYYSFLLPRIRTLDRVQRQICCTYNEADDSWVLELRRYGNAMGGRGSYLTFCQVTPRREAAVLRTVSRMPEARGLPSRRIGFPPMYFETLSSRVAKVSFHSDAAAVMGDRCT